MKTPKRRLISQGRALKRPGQTAPESLSAVSRVITDRLISVHHQGIFAYSVIPASKGPVIPAKAHNPSLQTKGPKADHGRIHIATWIT